MDSIRDLLRKKAARIDDEGFANDVKHIQGELDRHFNGKAIAKRLNDKGELLVTTRSAAVASEIRLKQLQIKRSLTKSLKHPIVKLRIRIQ